MASMILASSPLSVQSFVKLRTNSNYSHSPCYVSRAKTSYTHLPYNNISNIQSSKSLFTKGDGSFSFSSPKFPRVASKYSPSFSIIKAAAEGENIYHFYAHDVKTGNDVRLRRYKGHILLIVNLPRKISTENEIKEMQFLNDLRNRYKDKKSAAYGYGFEVLGFLPYMERSTRQKFKQLFSFHEEEEEKIDIPADFPIFIQGNRDFWNFLRKIKEKKNQTEQEQEEKFEKYLVDGDGKCIKNYPWFIGEQLEGSEDVIPGMFPGHDVRRPGGLKDQRDTLQDDIAEFFKKRDYTN